MTACATNAINSPAASPSIGRQRSHDRHSWLADHKIAAAAHHVPAPISASNRFDAHAALSVTHAATPIRNT